jgi:hypothetical protein
VAVQRTATFACTPGRELLLAAVSLLTNRIPAGHLDILDPADWELLCLSTVKLDLVRPGFRSLPKTTDADADEPEARSVQINSFGPRFCSALFFAST